MIKDYLDGLANTNQWGDELTLQAMAHSQRVNIQIISSKGAQHDRHYPDVKNPNWSTLYIGHYPEQHYVSTTLVTDMVWYGMVWYGMVCLCYA